MAQAAEFNCVYCEKTYKHRGWLASHIKKKHDDSHLLEDEMTVLRDNALDLSNKEAALNLSDNSPWNNTLLDASPRPSSTPRAPEIVPLCPKATNYVVEKGKTLPASFLTTLLPAQGFLTELSRSLYEQEEAPDPLQRFEEDIRCHLCQECGLSFIGSTKLKQHITSNHTTGSNPPGPDPAVLSLGDYLSNLENKIDHCNSMISRQSAMLSKLVALQEIKAAKAVITDKASPRNIELVEVEEDISANNLEPLNKEQTDIYSWEEPFKCDECNAEFNSKTSFIKHKTEQHKNIQQAMDCPFCSYKNSSELTVTKHIEDKHKERYSCDKCHKEFSSFSNLKKHKKVAHEPKTNKVIEIEDTDSEGTVNTDWCLLVGDSHTKSVKTRRIERKLKGNRLRNPAQSSPKAGSAYTTTRDWPGALYPDSNLAERVPKLLNERAYKSMIVLTPSNNITNVENMDTNKQNELAVKTALDTVAIVEKALKKSTTLKMAVIVELPPRADSHRLAGLTEFSNFALKAAVEKSALRSQITLASLDTLYNYSNQDIFGSPYSPIYDGIHMRGRHGGQAYTNCIVTAVAAAGLSKNQITTPDISTSNRYEALSN